MRRRRGPIEMRNLCALVGGIFLTLGVCVSWASGLPDPHPTQLVVETRTGPVAFSVEVASTPEQRAIGLMNRPEMASERGMLFRFEQTRDVLMWMKNTFLPLDMVFIREDGVVAGIAENTVPFSEAIVASPGPVRYVLELNAGVSARSGIAAGDTVRHPAILQAGTP